MKIIVDNKFAKVIESFGEAKHIPFDEIRIDDEGITYYNTGYFEWYFPYSSLKHIKLFRDLKTSNK